jgi:hypothetical protein
MTELQFDCAECGDPASAAVNSPQARAELCYRHYVRGIRFTFRGPAGGRQSFKDDTIAGLQREIIQGAAEQGREVRPKNKVNGAFI